MAASVVGITCLSEARRREQTRASSSYSSACLTENKIFPRSFHSLYLWCLVCLNRCLCLSNRSGYGGWCDAHRVSFPRLRYAARCPGGTGTLSKCEGRRCLLGDWLCVCLRLAEKKAQRAASSLLQHLSWSLETILCVFPSCSQMAFSFLFQWKVTDLNPSSLWS